MPPTNVYFYRDSTGRVPVLDWLRELGERDTKSLDACLARVLLLRTLGHELRRPHADFLRDGIYELRVRRGRVNYRMLYFLHGRDIAILAHALTKEQKVPPGDIERALQRKHEYEQNPEKHRATIEVPEDANDL